MRAAGTIAAVLIATFFGMWPAAARTQPILIDGHTDAKARGIWWSPARGWILDITGNGITRWQDTPAGCYRTPKPAPGTPLMGAITYRLFMPDTDGHAAGFQYLPGDANTRFARLSHLPARCGARNLRGEQAVFDVFAGIMDQRYAFFRQRRIDWPARIAAARPKVHDGMGQAALFDVLRQMMDGLDDSHTKLIARFNGKPHRVQNGLGRTLPFVRTGMGEQPWLQALVRQTLTEELDKGGRQIGNERIVWGTIGGTIGYIEIFTMGGYTTTKAAGSEEWAAAELAKFERMFNRMLTAFRGMDAIILDLSNNRGGYDAIAREIGARFTDQPFLGYTVRTYGNPDPPMRYMINPYDGPRYTGPVYVLTSDVTVSGGEIATMILKNLPNVTQVGETTRGSFSTPLAKPLPNGWYLELSDEIFAAPDGTVHEEHGITPDIVFPVYPKDAPVKGHAAAIRRIVDLVAQRKSRASTPR